MKLGGWIKLHRKIREHWIYQEDRTFSKYEAWLDLIMLANHKDKKTLVDNELLDVKRGQFVTSIRKLSKRWKWSNTKVKNFLELLKEDEMIKFKSDTKKTAVSIVNYDLYHEEDSKKHHKNDTPKIKNGQKSDAETTPKTFDTKGIEGLSEGEKRHESDTKAHKQESKELKRKDDERDPVIDLLIKNKIIHEHGIPPILHEDIVDIEENFGFENPNEMMIEAIKEAVRGNGRTWRFIYNKLNNWRARGIKNMNQLAEIQERQTNNTIPFKPKPRSRSETSALLDKYREEG